jgi:hypothetical protein
MRIVVPALVAALTLAACTSTTGSRRDGPVTCRPVFFGVAGSGQGVQNPPPEVVPAGVSRRDAASYGTTIGLLKTELEAVAGRALAATTAIDYPATSVSRYIGPNGLLADLAVSEQQGVDRLVGAIRHSYTGSCAARPVLLAGYSQGAEVVILAVNELTAHQQASVTVALLGNPSYLPGRPGDFPGRVAASGVRPAVLDVAFQLPTAVRSRTIDICAPGDGVCNVDPDRDTTVGKLDYVLAHTHAHTHDYAFGRHGYARRAAEFLWQHS